MSILDDFFGPAYDAVEQECKCLECRSVSSKQGGGYWVAQDQLWICDECWPQYEAREVGQKKEIEEAKSRIDSGTHTNADLDLMVRAGLACWTYGEPDSNRPTGIEWIVAGNQYADQVDY